MDELPADAADLLSPEAIEYWTTSGARFAADVSDELAYLRRWARELRRDGRSEIQIACAAAGWSGSPRRRPRADRASDAAGRSAMILERDPFERLPTTEER
jgi:hypothetical protein